MFAYKGGRRNRGFDWRIWSRQKLSGSRPISDGGQVSLLALPALTGMAHVHATGLQYTEADRIAPVDAEMAARQSMANYVDSRWRLPRA